MARIFHHELLSDYSLQQLIFYDLVTIFQTQLNDVTDSSLHCEVTYLAFILNLYLLDLSLLSENLSFLLKTRSSEPAWLHRKLQNQIAQQLNEKNMFIYLSASECHNNQANLKVSVSLCLDFSMICDISALLGKESSSLHGGRHWATLGFVFVTNSCAHQ